MNFDENNYAREFWKTNEEIRNCQKPIGDFENEI